MCLVQQTGKDKGWVGLGLKPDVVIGNKDEVYMSAFISLLQLKQD
jgi:hypothetical protein